MGLQQNEGSTNLQLHLTEVGTLLLRRFVYHSYGDEITKPH